MLRARAFDVERAIGSRKLTLLDAGDVLSRFLVGDTPDPTRFEETFGTIFGDVLTENPGAHLRAYGEMVDLLCARKLPQSAIRLEHLWNRLAGKFSFTLFCAYALQNISEYGDDIRRSLAETHARVLPPDRQSNPDPETVRMLLESVRDYAIFMLDPNGVVTTWNEGARAIKQYTASEIIGRHFSLFYPEADVRAGKCERELAIADHDGRFEDEGWRLRKDGSRFWANVVITALRDSNGSLRGFAKVTRDLTERREAERERVRLTQAQEANRVRDEFLATISHELRTPLNAILGWSSLLLSRVKDPELEKGLATIARNARTQARLIDDVLDVSRIVTGKLRIDVKPADLATIVHDAIEVVRPTADAKGLTIAVDRLDAPALLIGDPVRLQQVVWNLLSNAVKFTDRGGSIHVRLEQNGPLIHLSVRDTGQGIEPEFLPHVFERFRQSDSSSTRKVGGLGLGLAIVRSLVELHGGKVDVESEGVGKGATFHVSLPVRAVAPEPKHDAHADKAAEAPTTGGVRLDGLRVLVVDDEADARELIAVLLVDRGAIVEMCANAREARHQVAVFKPQVIVSDIGMPEIDGYQFIRGLRALPRERGGAIPAVALSAYTREGDKRRAFEAGFNNHLAKPIDADELASVIRNLAKLIDASPTPDPRNF